MRKVPEEAEVYKLCFPVEYINQNIIKEMICCNKYIKGNITPAPSLRMEVHRQLPPSLTCH
jgi:hypothetical protein